MQLCLALDDQFELQASLGNQVQLLRSMRRLDEAIVLADRQVNVCRSLADESAVARALATKATMLADRGDVHQAIELTESFADSARIEGDRRGLAEALLNLSVMHTQLGPPIARRSRSQKPRRSPASSASPICWPESSRHTRPRSGSSACGPRRSR